jgi:hypothetical protein
MALLDNEREKFSFFGEIKRPIVLVSLLFYTVVIYKVHVGLIKIGAIPDFFKIIKNFID